MNKQKSLLTKKQLLSSVNGKLFFSILKPIYFTSVCIDSREVCKNSLFVPLVGLSQNGHKYIPTALEQGASVVFVNEAEFLKSKDEYFALAKKYKKVSFVIVIDTKRALQDAARAYVEKFPKLKKIAITGSSGKTTTKEIAISIFKQEFNVIATKGNFNSETGLPLSVFNIRKEHEVGIFEMGMNRENEIAEIASVLKPNYAIISNIGTAHIGKLGSREDIAREKKRVFDYVMKDGFAFIPEDDDFVEYLSSGVKGNVVRFGPHLSDAKIEYLKNNGTNGCEFRLNESIVNFPLGGEYNFKNALGVIACALKFGMKDESIKKGLEEVKNLSGRLNIQKATLKNKKCVTLIKDYYNANFDSMKASIEFTNGIENQGKKIYVLADMKELGEKSKEFHSKIGGILSNVGSAIIFLIGSDMIEAKNELLVKNPNQTVVYFKENSEENFAEIANRILALEDEDSVILLKGSHSMAVEQLIPLLVLEEEKNV
ncbi:MAG: UDP-N-acetylmuramoyl-tripeptide--D-alanyl-D-alanine ligase [Treponema sp.]|nr:UDP-N-acetylmuramoyl-tripeptide--D-alanyl-D-alanine ligase [Treponema sp.]